MPKSVKRQFSGDAKTHTQSVRFKKEKFTEIQAKKC